MNISGNRAFERCDVKVVEFVDYVYVDKDRKNVTITQDAARDPRPHGGNGAVLHCPRTEDDRVNVESQFSNHPTRERALNSLKSLAGKLICRDCRFSSMTPVEVSIARTELAEAEKARIIAYAALMEARNELETINGQYQIEKQ